MTKAIETNAILVTGVDAQGVQVEVNGRRERIDWITLDVACNQTDAELRETHRKIRQQAHRMAADGPVVVSVGQDSSNVWWVCGVSALYGGGRANYDRRADEGGTHPNQMLAACEAEDICQRLGKRVVRREGFDGPAAKARAARIVGR